MRAAVATTTSSVDRQGEWKSCCLHALGYDDFDDHDDLRDDDDDDDDEQPAKEQSSPPKSQEEFTFVNLVTMSSEESTDSNTSNDDDMMQEDNVGGNNAADSNDDSDDHWMQALNEIDAGLHRMVSWMQEKKWAYVHAATPEQEASLIQSTISSYIATTANELESMRQMVVGVSEQQQQQHSQQQNQQQQQQNQQQRQQHQMTMVQTLLEQLKEELAVPFGKLQKQRQRKAVRLWQNPLQCKLFIPNTSSRSSTINNLDGGLDDTNEVGEQRFLPTKPHHSLQQNFLDSYALDPSATPAPKRPGASILNMRPLKRALGHEALSTPADSGSSVDNKRPKAAALAAAVARQQQSQMQPQYLPQQNHHDNEDNDALVQREEEYQAEAAMLTAQLVDNQYDAVQKMESSMVTITTLLTQFSELVSNQQEEVWEIHQAATTAKENVQKGKENLVDATESTKSSKHYMASAITSMGIVLLVFHWIRY